MDVVSQAKEINEKWMAQVIRFVTRCVLCVVGGHAHMSSAKLWDFGKPYPFPLVIITNQLILFYLSGYWDPDADIICAAP